MILQRFDNIEKSPNDKRQYRGLELANHLKVLLISDEQADKSAAALTVGVGSMSDPKDLQGLAHFCEHMLFLGTEKYPVENTYNKFISEHGGFYNASTASDMTEYHFEIAPSQLAEGLDMFAQFFLAPLFTESATEREVKAVDSEHQKNIPNDCWRRFQLDNHLAKPGHPYNTFITGNIDILWKLPKIKGINVREELLKFHEKWYSSNIMTLVILGKESLEDLEKMVVNLFATIKNKEVQRPEWKENPFGEDQFQTCIYMSPVNDFRELIINFPFEDMTEVYKSKPAQYLSHLIGHEGPGSILSHLKSKNWATSLHACEWNYARGIASFQIGIALTKDGLRSTNNIIKIIFQYINLIKSEPPKKWIHNEIQVINEIDFRFKEKISPTSYVTSLSGKLQSYPMEDILTSNNLTSEWKPEIIKKLLNYLDPKNIRVMVIAKEFDFDLELEEPFYGTKYKLTKIPESTIQDWINCGLNPDLKFPQENSFIPRNLDLLALDQVKKHPVIIKETALTRVWFKQDNEFLVPKAKIVIRIKSPLIYLDPLNSLLTGLFIDLFRHYFEECAYAAKMTKMNWSVFSYSNCIEISVDGFNDKMDVFLKALMNELVVFKIDHGQFEIFKQKSLEHWKNIEVGDLGEQVWFGLFDCLRDRYWNYLEYLKVISDVSVDKLTKFIPQIFSKIHIEFLIHGNINKDKALSIAESVEECLKRNFDAYPVLPQLFLPHREVQLKNQWNYVYEIHNKAHTDNRTTIYFQCGLESTEGNVKVNLIKQIFEEPCFSILRTKEQLGYIVHCYAIQFNSVNALRINVQSHRHPQYLDQRIEEFLNYMKDVLKSMSAEEFDSYKEALAVQMLEKPKHLLAQTSIYSREIWSQYYHFDRVNVEVDYLRSVSKSDIIEFFEKNLAAGAPERRKLSIYVYGTTIKPYEKDGEFGKKMISDGIKNDERTVFIKDVVEFKKIHGYYPLVPSYVDINTLKD